MDNEQWKFIPSTGWGYSVSSLGQIKSHLSGERVLKQRTDKYGYKTVRIKVNGKFKSQFVHRLMASSFLGSFNDSLDVDHINGIKEDNRLVNLRMCSKSENQRSFKRVYGSSKFRGVHFCKQKRKWRAQIKTDDTTCFLGLFEHERLAAMAWNEKAVELGYSQEAMNPV